MKEGRKDSLTDFLLISCIFLLTDAIDIHIYSILSVCSPPFRSSIRLSARPPVRPSVRPTASSYYVCRHENSGTKTRSLFLPSFLVAISCFLIPIALLIVYHFGPTRTKQHIRQMCLFCVFGTDSKKWHN